MCTDAYLILLIAYLRMYLVHLELLLAILIFLNLCDPTEEGAPTSANKRSTSDRRIRPDARAFLPLIARSGWSVFGSVQSHQHEQLVV